MNRLRYSLILGAVLVAGLVAQEARAADVLVISNLYAQETADDFAANTSHTFTAWDASMTPTQKDLDPYDVLLVFEDGNFDNVTNVGEALATFAAGGGDVVLGTFYWQGRSDGGGAGWGTFENIDPFTSAAGACEYSPDDLDPASVVVHDMTTGVASLMAEEYRGGLTAKDDTVVLATWAGLNDNDEPDPVVGYRIEGDSCIAGIGIAPHYSAIGAIDVDFGGDFYALWDNVLESADNDCAFCGSGLVEPGEECDDLVESEACDLDCTFSVCGDGVFNATAGEACDDGAESDACNADCSLSVCGDGILNETAGEACDDGGLEPGDGCDATCLVEDDGTSTGPDTDGGSDTDADTDAGSDTDGSSDTEGGSDTNGGSDTDGGSDSDSDSDSDSETASGSDSESDTGLTASASDSDPSGGDDGSGGADTDGDSGGGGADDGGGCSTGSGAPGFGWLALFGLVGLRRRRDRSGTDSHERAFERRQTPK